MAVRFLHVVASSLIAICWHSLTASSTRVSYDYGASAANGTPVSQAKMLNVTSLSVPAKFFHALKLAPLKARVPESRFASSPNTLPASLLHVFGQPSVVCSYIVVCHEGEKASRRAEIRRRKDNQLVDDSAPVHMAFAFILVGMLLFDAFFAHRLMNTYSSHFRMWGATVLIAVAYCGFLWKLTGEDNGLAWATGYFLEYALSMDNLFIYRLILTAFGVPRNSKLKALVITIYIAMISKTLFFVCLKRLFDLGLAVNIIFGTFLVLSGYLAIQDSEEGDVDELLAVRCFRWLLGSRLKMENSEDASLFSKSADGRWQVTILFVVICVLTVTDTVFSTDSIGLKLASVDNIYINITSSLCALFGLRSLFFVIEDLNSYFEYVKYGICCVLVFIGMKMIMSQWIDFHLFITLIVIDVALTVSIVASVTKACMSRGQAGRKENKRAKLIDRSKQMNAS